MRKLLIRVDGNFNIGLGHIYRGIALAQMVQDSFSVIFVTQPDTTITPFKDTGLKYIFLDENIDILHEALWFKKNFSEDTLIALDGYQFTEEYQRKIKAENFPLIYIDDLIQGVQKADIVINHCPGVKETDYKKEPYTQFALGLKYAILRPLFIEAIEQKRKITKIDTAFVCFGGSDIHDLTLKFLIPLLETKKFKKINLVIGGAYKHSQIFEIQKQHTNVHIYQNLSEKQLISVMYESNFAIAPSSNILFELMAVKMPVISGYYVENQEHIYEDLKNKKAIIPIGNISKVDTPEIINTIDQAIHIDNISDIIQRQEGLFSGKIKEKFLTLINSLNA